MMNIMIHKSEIINYPGSMEELVEEIGNLKYDALARFLELLANKIETDGKKDEARNRIQLSGNLYMSAERLIESKVFIEKAWGICSPYMH
jgi:hypothetical protein